MKSLLSIIAALALVVLGVSAFARTADPVSHAGSVVKVMLKGGHSSGVHIGGGWILTAAHVTREDRTVKVKTDDGGVMNAEVLWSTHDPVQGGYDVAMVRVENFKGVAASKLSCAPSYVGQHIRIVGNPLRTEFATSWGRVSKVGTSGLEKYWQVLVTLDAAATNGVSGGAVFDDQTGELVGLLVAGYPGTGYTFMVPGRTVCDMLARVA